MVSPTPPKANTLEPERKTETHIRHTNRHPGSVCARRQCAQYSSQHTDGAYLFAQRETESGANTTGKFSFFDLFQFIHFSGAFILAAIV